MNPIESKRVALDRRIILRFADFDGFVAEYAANLSMTGMFVRSKAPQKAGTPVSFELRLEDGARLVRGSGWVVWSRDAREAPDRPAGMGIEFTELDQTSRRLVRWMILSQVPEGEKPFEVHAGTASAPATVRLVSRSAARRSRVAGVLTAVVIFSVLAALVYWGFSARSGPDAAAPRAQARLIDSAAPFEHQAAPVQEAADPIPVSQVADQRDRTSEAEAIAAIETAVRSWASAWSEQDVDRYLSHYAAEFTPENELSRGDWSNQRRRRITAPKSIRVGVTRLETRLLSEVQARVSFLQTYRSDGYADTVDKVLTLARGEDGWKIRREVTD